MTFDMKTIGRNLKELRISTSLGQKQIAEYLCVDQSLISKFEAGERIISMEMLDKLAVLFCCPMRALLSVDRCETPMAFAFRSKNLQSEDLQALAIMNRIALNQMQMDNMTKEEEYDR